MISNILEQEDIVKGLPDAALQKEARAPSGALQQFLVVSEIKRRTDMRKSHENQMKEQPQGTVADQIVMEGIASMMPQQGVGMPPQMGPQMPPQGMPPQMPPQMPPSGMPPMGMAAGGIVRMQNMGQVPSNNRVDTLKDILESNPSISFIDLVGMGFTQDDLERLRTMGYRERLASERVLSDAIAGLERVDPPMRLSKTMPLPEVKPASEIYSQSGVTDFAGDVSRAMQTPIATAGDRATLERIRSGLSPSISSSDIDAGIAGMVSERAPRSKPPPSGTRPPKAVTGGIDLGALGDIDSAVGGGFMSTYGLIPQYSTRDYLGEGLSAIEPVGDYIAGKGDALLEGIGTLRELLPDNPARSVKDFALGPFADNREMIAAADRIRPVVEDMNQVRMDEQARLLADLQLDAMEGDEQAAKQVAKLLTRTDAQVQGGGVEVQPNAGAGVASGSALGDPKGESDAQTRTLEAVIAAQSEGESPARASFNSAISSIDELISDLKNKEIQQSPALDLSELIADSKRMAKANALMQLGAGIAAGDTAKALSAAGTAAAKGMEDARTLDMRKRLAEYQAGREDIRRGEQRDLDIAKLGIQKGQLEMMDTRLANELNKAERVSKGQLFSLVADLVGDATEGMMAEDRLATVDKLSSYFMQKYAPLLGIGLTESDLKLLGGTFSGAGGGASGGTRAPMASFVGK